MCMVHRGIVESIDDPKKLSRVRVRVEGVFGNIPTEHLPYASPRYIQKNNHDLPAVGSLVYIHFMNDDVMYPFWYTKNTVDLGLSDDDYKSAQVLINKDLSLYDSRGKVNLRFEESKGLTLSFSYNDTLSEIVIRPDNTIFIKNENTDKVVHITETISLGSEDVSAQPAVLGDTNNEALDKTNETIEELKDTIISNMDKLSNTASSSPYTSPLAPLFKLLSTELTANIDPLIAENTEFYPTTKSEVVTLD